MTAAGPRLALVVAPGTAFETVDPGLFAAVVPIERTKEGSACFRAQLSDAVDLAETAGCDWLVAPSPGERLRSDALALASPALDAYEAIFGAVHVAAGDAVWRPSRLAFDTSDRLPHAILNWWVGATHIVRVAAVRDVLSGMHEAAGEGDELDYLFRLWDGHRCIKLAQTLLDLATEPRLRSESERRVVLDRLAREPVFLSIPFGIETYRLPYTGVNAGIEREQTRGLFFEAAELDVLRERLGPGRHIVDIGANTGNHTVYFAGPLRAASVVPFEPLPDVAAILARTVAENRLSNVDLSRLGVGVSDRAGRARVVRSERGGLGASRLEDDAEGSVEVLALDDALTEAPDFLKIDVESMEMRVLLGAEKIIAASRPVIFIEIANDNTGAFMEWLAGWNYRIERIFSDKGHSNYLIAPDGSSRKW